MKLQEEFQVVAVRDLSYFTVARQPDIVNTLRLSDATVTRPVSILTIDSRVVEDPTTAVSPVTDSSGYACGLVGFPSVQRKRRNHNSLYDVIMTSLLQLTTVMRLL